MKTFLEFIAESATPTQEDIKKVMSEIESSFLTQFPNCYLEIDESKGISHSIDIEFGLIMNKNELPNSIRDNDPAFHRFIIFVGKDGFEAQATQGGISVETDNKYLAMEIVKTPFRKTKGNADKIIKAFKTFTVRLKALVKENESKIYKRSMYKDVYFK